MTGKREFLNALRFMTIIPVPSADAAIEPDWLSRCAKYFPVVGIGIGLASAVVMLLAGRIWSPVVASLLAVAASIIITGALHEDGLADCFDAFGGAYTGGDALRIMHDSRIGTFGAIALVIVLALKWQTLAALPPMRAAWLMIAAHAASRTFAISYLLTLEYVRAEGKAKPVAQRMSYAAFALAAICGLPWLFWPDWKSGCLCVAVLVVMRFFIGRYFVRRIGGYTGDCLGFAQQLFELAIYLTGLGWISS